MMKRTKFSITNEQALELFSSDNYLTVNKKLLTHYGPEVAIFLSNLVDKHLYFQYNNQLEDGEWFYLIHAQQMEQTGLTETKLRRCKHILGKDGIVETRMSGGSAKDGHPHVEYYKLNISNLIKTVHTQSFENLRINPSKTLGLNINKPKYKEKNNKKVELEQFLLLFPKEWQDNRSFQNSLEDFTIHRRQKGSLLTPIARNRIANKLIKHDLQIAVDALDLSVDNGWTGVFPESIKLPHNDSPKKSPREIVYEYFEGKRDKLYIESFYKTYCKNAEDLLVDRSDEQCSILAENMMALHQWIDENQADEAKDTLGIPNASILLGYYVDWLETQDWLTVEPRHFTPDDKIFRSKFLPWENDYIGFNVMTGKY